MSEPETFRVRDHRGRPAFARVYLNEIEAAAHWPSADFRVYVALLAFCDGPHGWAVSWRRVAQVTGLHRDTVRDSVRRLRLAGVIAVAARFRDGWQDSNEITILEWGGLQTPQGEGLETPPRVDPQTPPPGGLGTPQTRPTGPDRPCRTIPPNPPRGVPDELTLAWVREVLEDQVREYGWTDLELERNRTDQAVRSATVRNLVRLSKQLRKPSQTRPELVGVSTSARRLERALVAALELELRPSR